MPDELVATSLPTAPRTSNRLMGALLVLTIGGFGLGGLQMAHQSERFHQLEEKQSKIAQANQAQLEAIASVVRDLGVGIEQQGALVQRVVGNVIPIKIPEGTEQGFSHIEKQLESLDALLASQNETESLSAALTSLVERLPAWVQAELFPRILPARWQLDALRLLQRTLPENDPDALQDLAARLAAHALSRPQGVPDTLETLLVKRAQDLAQTAEQRSDALTAKQTKDAPRQNLALRIEALEQDAALFERLGDPELKARLAISIHTATQDLRIAAQAIQFEDADLTKRLRDLASVSIKRVDDIRVDSVRQQQALSRKYQVWALEQINSVPTLETIKEQKLAGIANGVARNNPLSNDRQDALKRAEDELVRLLVERLAVIDSRLLDDAVGEWHHKVFSDRFAGLNEAHQREVVRGFALATKRIVEELP